MRRKAELWCVVLFCFLVAAASGALVATRQPREPITAIPTSTGVDPARAAIGERLFNDVRLSLNHTQACATCHPLDRGGMDGLRVAVRLDGRPHYRNTPTVFNASLNASFNWDGVATTLEAHTDRVVQRLMNMTWPTLIERLRGDGRYISEFSTAYPDRLTRENVLNAIATYERTLVTPGSRFDRYLSGEPSALTPREVHGYQLFKSYGCASCHQGVNIGGNMYQRFGVFEEARPQRAGPPDEGRFLVTRVPRDTRVFRVPSLRNVAVTAPYFHDGHAPTLENAVEIMGRVQLGRALTPEETGVLVSFLKTLTGEHRGRPLESPARVAR
jgi:cytochrome c peroxidase